MADLEKETRRFFLGPDEETQLFADCIFRNFLKTLLFKGFTAF